MSEADVIDRLVLSGEPSRRLTRRDLLLASPAAPADAPYSGLGKSSVSPETIHSSPQPVSARIGPESTVSR